MATQDTNQQVKVEDHPTERFYAEPTNPKVKGFHFSDGDEFDQKARALCNRLGISVITLNLTLIDGSIEVADLFKACRVNQQNLGDFIRILNDLDSSYFPALFYLCDSANYCMEHAMDKLDNVAIYFGNLEDASQDLFDELYAQEIPEHLRNYIDYKAFANDCQQGGDMYEFEFAGETYTCVNANYV